VLKRGVTPEPPPPPPTAFELKYEGLLVSFVTPWNNLSSENGASFL
jgi:hypothetical protein